VFLRHCFSMASKQQACSRKAHMTEPMHQALGANSSTLTRASASSPDRLALGLSSASLCPSSSTSSEPCSLLSSSSSSLSSSLSRWSSSDFTYISKMVFEDTTFPRYLGSSMSTHTDFHFFRNRLCRCLTAPHCQTKQLDQVQYQTNLHQFLSKVLGHCNAQRFRIRTIQAINFQAHFHT
jgi:hypothetical protein